MRAARDGEADAVFGSRMLEKGGALRGGMPLYKFVGNRILTWFQNRLLGAGSASSTPATGSTRSPRSRRSRSS